MKTPTSPAVAKLPARRARLAPVSGSEEPRYMVQVLMSKDATRGGTAFEGNKLVAAARIMQLLDDGWNEIHVKRISPLNDLANPNGK